MMIYEMALEATKKERKHEPIPICYMLALELIYVSFSNQLINTNTANQ